MKKGIKQIMATCCCLFFLLLISFFSHNLSQEDKTPASSNPQQAIEEKKSSDNQQKTEEKTEDNIQQETKIETPPKKLTPEQNEQAMQLIREFYPKIHKLVKELESAVERSTQMRNFVTEKIKSIHALSDIELQTRWKELFNELITEVDKAKETAYTLEELIPCLPTWIKEGKEELSEKRERFLRRKPKLDRDKEDAPKEFKSSYEALKNINEQQIKIFDTVIDYLADVNKSVDSFSEALRQTSKVLFYLSEMLPDIRDGGIIAGVKGILQGFSEEIRKHIETLVKRMEEVVDRIKGALAPQP